MKIDTQKIAKLFQAKRYSELIFLLESFSEKLPSEILNILAISRLLNKKDEKDRTHAFFNQGKLNDWNSILPNEIKESIENKFYKEMKELGYL